MPSARRSSASSSLFRRTLELNAPARPRSEEKTTIAARFGFSASRVRMWSTLEYVATADTARVTARAYGRLAATRCCAFAIREAEMSSIARVIFFVVCALLILER